MWVGVSAARARAPGRHGRCAARTRHSYYCYCYFSPYYYYYYYYYSCYYYYYYYYY